jgi:MYXO-CTERM domain-containing protein
MSAATLLAAGSAYGQAFNQTFDTGVPAGWTVTNTTAVVWRASSSIGYTNYTGGSGESVVASSDNAGTMPYDTKLITPLFVVPSAANLNFRHNFQQFASDPSFGDVDISTNAGASWTNLLHFTVDTPVGGLFTPGGAAGTASLAAYGGQAANIRFRYWTTNQAAFDWYWQVDNVSVTPAPGALALIGLAGLATRRRRA